MQFEHVFTPAKLSMKKPLLVAASVALSALTGSAPALALTNADAVLWSDSVFGKNFIFQDSRLDTVRPNHEITLPFFAQLFEIDYNSPTSDKGYFGAYRYELQVSISDDNPYLASIGEPGNGYASWSYSNHDLRYRNGDAVISYTYCNFGVGVGQGCASNSNDSYLMDTYRVAEDGTVLGLTHWESRGGGRGEFYSYSYPDVYNHGIDGGNSTEPFDLEEIKSKMQFDLPTSGVGLFDFENSFVYFEGEGVGVSLAQILAGTDEVWLTSFASNGGIAAGFDDFGNRIFSPGSNLTLSWETDRQITGMTLAYNLAAIPEPETWAMLLAGLGIVGAVVPRRQRARAAM